MAFVVAQNSMVDEAEVREFLRKRLPGYMVPSRFVPIDEFPMTASGKVNRKALVVDDHPSTGVSSNGELPRTPLERDIATVWCDVLGVESVGVTDDFFDLGGHSLDAMRVNVRLRESFNIDLSLGSFFEEPTVEGQALTVTGELATQLAGEGGLEALVSEIGGPTAGLDQAGN